MYPAVPKMTPARVASSVSVGELAGFPEAASASKRFRQAEIQHLYFSVRGELDVGGLQIAMDNALFVRRFQGLGDLAGNPQRFIQRNGAAGDAFLQRRPFHQLHHQRAHAARFFQAVYRGDIGMAERRQRLRLSLQTRHAVTIVCK